MIILNIVFSGLSLFFLLLYVLKCMEHKSDRKFYEKTIENERLRTEKFKKISTIDLLTGLNNEFNLPHRLNQEISKVARGASSFVVYFDINNFKNLNDKYGHLVGDDVLKTLSKALKKGLRAGISIFRLHGDEFVLIVPDLEVGEVENFANHLLVLFSKVKIEQFPEIRVTASVGITQITKEEQSVIINRADLKMYEAKKADPERVGKYKI